MDIAMCNCEWPDPHPPHVYADTVPIGMGLAKMKLFGCTVIEPKKED